MEKLIFDTHAHYDDRAFRGDVDEVLAGLGEKGVCGLINASSNMKSAARTVKFTQKYPFVWGAVGVHPHDAQNVAENDYDKLEEYTKIQKVIAVGEIGLDYHYDFSPRETQSEVFRRQLELAREVNLPVIVHDREAHEDVMTLLREFHPQGVVHCFFGDLSLAREVMELGMYIGIGGAVTFKSATDILEVAREIPLDRLLLETDAPYMTPVPFRGKRCDSGHISYTASKIAELRGMPAEELLRCCLRNAERLFKINMGGLL